MVRTRIAPSPTGFPHIGTIYQAIFDKALVIKHGGQFIFRLEDTDRKRLVEGSEEIIYQSLDWVNLVPDEGPREDGPYGPYRQSQRLEVYKKYAEDLVKVGGGYYCFCSPERLEEVRAEQEKNHQPTIYDQHCRNLPGEEVSQRVKNGEAYVVRLKIPLDQKITVEDSIRGQIIFDSKLIDDTVLLKSDGFPTYHLAAVVDDYLMKITHPIRGEEWISSYPKHKILFDYFGWPMPIYTHLPLLRNPDGSKVSKRQGHTFVKWYEEQGILPEALVNFLILMVWKHPDGKEIFSLPEFARLFEFKDISLTGPRFDLKKLEWMNGEYIRSFNVDEDHQGKLAGEISHYLQMYSKNSQMSKLSATEIKEKGLVTLVIERIKKLADFEPLVSFLFQDNIVYEPGLEVDQDLVKLAKAELEKVEAWDSATLEATLRQAAQDRNIKPADLFTSIRNAVSGRKVTPPLFGSLAILGKEKTLERLEKISMVPPAGAESGPLGGL